MTSKFIFENLDRPVRIAACRAIGFVLTQRLLDWAKQECIAENAAAQMGVDGLNDFESEREARYIASRMRREQGFDESFTPPVMATLLGAAIDECKTLAETRFDEIEDFPTAIKRRSERDYNPKAEFAQDAIKRMMKEYGITEEHATAKFAARMRKSRDSFSKYDVEINEKLDELMKNVAQKDSFDDAFQGLSATNQRWVLLQGAGGVEREAARMRERDAKYDWDDMLAQAKLLEAALPLFGDALRPLAHAGDALTANA